MPRIISSVRDVFRALHVGRDFSLHLRAGLEIASTSAGASDFPEFNLREFKACIPVVDMLSYVHKI